MILGSDVTLTLALTPNPKLILWLPLCGSLWADLYNGSLLTLNVFWYRVIFREQAAKLIDWAKKQKQRNFKKLEVC